ncbi:NAD-binding protein [Allorhizocola rhizosphaerae]|uniref:NAD-binding protein n=1 Tax=Allorhizocola rhizosphaerae TaxID=1872709 RepID=UPI0013C2C414|nr:NAD-binding protein [Allorhizocola rhizosphaerae]
MPLPLPSLTGRRPRGGHFVINGSDGLAYRLADQLCRRYGADVVVLMTKQEHRAARDFTELPRVRLVVVERVDEKALIKADVATASGLALTVQDDVGNIHVALQARELAPKLRIVVRMYNTHLGQGIENLLGDCRVLSDAEIAAPALIATALGEVAANPVHVASRTLIVARRGDVPPQDIVCGLADTGALGGPALLPADSARANLVLAEAVSPEAEDLISTVRLGNNRRRRWWGMKGAWTFVRALFSRKLGMAFLTVAAILVVSGALLAWQDLKIDTWQGFYLTVVTALGGLQENYDLTRFEQVLQLFIGIAGLALVPLVTALIVEGVVNARIAVAQGRLAQPREGHVVVVGMGGVGTRVLRLLHDRGLPVVAIDHNENARGIPLAAEFGIPVIIGDASRETTLRSAGVDRCRAMMAVASTDVINLEAALHGRNLQPGLRVLVRLFDEDLAARARKTLDLQLSSSVSYVAAPAFAEALMDREVIGTISVGRRVLLLAQVIVTKDSALDGAPLDTADDPGAVRVIAHQPVGEPRPQWNPQKATRLRALDQLTAVCTRDGLTRLLRQAAAVV